MDTAAIREQFESGQPWERRADGWWLADDALDVADMARVLTRAPARLITLTARPAAGGEYRLAYHWDADGEMLTFVAVTRGRGIPSLAALCPAADWIEREVHDYFDIRFLGRAEVPPLVLRAGQAPGVFCRNGDDRETR